MSNIYPLLPRLTVNERFINELISAQAPCFGLGLVEERKQECGFLALRLNKSIPKTFTNIVFRFGHSLFENAEFEVVHFAFEIYGFETYNVLLNPNNPVIKTVLAKMVETGDYFLYAIFPNERVTAFRSEIGQETLSRLKTNLQRIQNSRITETQYQKAVSMFERNPEPPGKLLNWVCRDNVEYLDITKNRLKLNLAVRL